MSGASGTAPCPRCGGAMDTYYDWKPFDTTTSTCHECGFHTYTAIGVKSLAELNDERQDADQPLLTTLVSNDRTRKFDADNGIKGGE